MKLNFRLSTLMVFTTLVALALAVVILSRRNAELKNQVDFLSSELGYLVIDNPDHIHAVNINRQGDVVRWRVHIPQSGQYEVVVVEGTDPYESTSAKRMCELPSSELMFSTAISHIDNGWMLQVAFDPQGPSFEGFGSSQTYDWKKNCAIMQTFYAGNLNNINIAPTESSPDELKMTSWSIRDVDSVFELHVVIRKVLTEPGTK